MTVDLDFERQVLDGLGRLLLTPRDRQDAATVLLAVSARTDEIPAIAFKHKVTPIMAKNARDLAAGSPPDVAAAAERLTHALSEDDRKAMAHRGLLFEEVRRLAPVLAGRACLIKGFCNGRFYPFGYERWMRDIDVYCRSWTAALELMDMLFADGYSVDLDECGWVKADPANGREVYGQIFLIRPMGDDFSRVDIHFGTYSVGYAGYLDTPDEGLVDELDLGDTAVPVLNPRLIPLIAQAHALSDGYVAAKDVNDFVALAMTTTLDWTSIGQELAAHQLHPQAALLARHTLGLYDHPRVQSAARRLLSGSGTPRSTIWQMHNRSWGLRAAVNASFAARWRRAHGGGLGSSVLDAARCYLFYVRRMQLTVGDPNLRELLLRSMMARADVPQWALRPDACTLLVDAEVLADRTPPAPGSARTRNVLDPLPGVSVLESGSTTLVALRGRVFVPTVDLIISQRDARCAVTAALTTVAR